MTRVKIVFLDFDGVLNSREYRSTRPPLDPKFCWGTPEHEDWSIDRSAVLRLNRLAALPDVAIVVSSMWRIPRSRADLRGLLTRNGFTGTLICKTPVLNKPRGVEVREWLRQTERNVSSFVILDDDDDFYEFGADRLVLTSGDTGLLDEHVDLAAQILAKPWAKAETKASRGHCAKR